MLLVDGLDRRFLIFMWTKTKLRRVPHSIARTHAVSLIKDSEKLNTWSEQGERGLNSVPHHQPTMFLVPIDGLWLNAGDTST